VAQMSLKLCWPRGLGAHRISAKSALGFGVYTVLPLPILYGVWHTKGGSGGGRTLRNRCARALQLG